MDWSGHLAGSPGTRLLEGRWTGVARQVSWGVTLTAAVLALAACTPAPRYVDTPVTSPVPTKADTGEVVVGVSNIAGGYNPHDVADQSAITTALADVLLPSVFRPGPDGVPQLDRTVMTSASVTSADPYTVTYQIRIVVLTDPAHARR